MRLISSGVKSSSSLRVPERLMSMAGQMRCSGEVYRMFGIDPPVGSAANDDLLCSFFFAHKVSIN
jgi:hypothetical protein